MTPEARVVPDLYTISVSDDVLADLHARLRATRWPDDLGNDDGYYGMPGSYLRELVDYWSNGFDWRDAERGLNAFANHRVPVDGVPVHFIRQPGTGPAPIPLILTLGTGP
jgi:epoxide hydrolase-like protein